MKQPLTVSDKTVYRYLKNRDHFDFHGEVFNIFYPKSDDSNFLQSAFQDLLQDAFCNPSPSNAEQSYQTHQQLVMLLELAFLLHEDRDDLEYILHGELIDDHATFKLSGELKSGITPCNAQSQVSDKPESPRVFFNSFYQQRSLNQWRSMVDELLHLATGHQSQDSICIFRLSDVISAQSYMQKLIAYMIMVYTDTVLPHIKQQHPG